MKQTLWTCDVPDCNAYAVGATLPAGWIRGPTAKYGDWCDACAHRAPTAECPGCGHTVPLDAAGRLYRHNTIDGGRSRMNGSRRSAECWAPWGHRYATLDDALRANARRGWGDLNADQVEAVYRWHEQRGLLDEQVKRSRKKTRAKRRPVVPEGFVPT